MNIFIIPSWYPSKSNPIYGIFNQEQALILASQRPHFNVGVSKWGQGDERFLLPAYSPSSIFKIFKKHDPQVSHLRSNLTEYFTPAFTWTRKVLKGNIDGIYNSNKRNLEQFINQYGKADIICAQATYPAALIAKRLAQELDVPYTVTIFMSPFPFNEFLDKKGQLKSLISEPLQNANRLLSSCNALMQTMRSFELQNISVIPLPVDTDYFTPDQSTIPAKITILSVGRLEEQKGYDILLRAIQKIDEPIELRIAGDGSLLNKYKKLAIDLKLDQKVKWLGLLDKSQVREEMRSCSFYVLSSRHETFGIVQTEAMACGKPVVATKCGGPEDIISESNGILCENEDVQSLSDAIKKMITEYKTFSSEKIRKETVLKYGPEAWVNQIENVFKEIIAM
ncbi:glycosyltransferase [Ekhidna sp.]|uniref:glycosyltransferase n=1 Tax=Ekhidna sp. TaxID=2608089 RepID=UPI003B514636